MSIRIFLPACFMVALIFLSLCTAGCQATGRTRADDLQSNLSDVQEGISEGMEHVDLTLASLTALTTEKADLTEPYKTFIDELEDLESHSEDLRAEAEDLREKGKIYFDSWQQDMNKITNEDLKKRSEERKEELRANYEEIQKVREESREIFGTFLSDLNDIRQYLDTDLSPAGVQGVGDMIEKANQDGAAVKERAGEIIDHIEEVMEAVTSKLPPPKPQPAENGPAEENAPAE